MEQDNTIEEQDEYKLLDKDRERERVESIAREQEREQELIKVSNRIDKLLFHNL